MQTELIMDKGNRNNRSYYHHPYNNGRHNVAHNYNNNNNEHRNHNNNNNDNERHNQNNNNNNERRNHKDINNNNEQWVRPLGLERQYPHDQWFVQREERNNRVDNCKQQRNNVEERIRIAEEELARARRMRIEAEEA